MNPRAQEWANKTFQMVLEGLRALVPILHRAVEGLCVLVTLYLTLHTVLFAFEIIKMVIGYKDAALLGALAAPLTALFTFVGTLQGFVLSKYITSMQSANGDGK